MDELRFILDVHFGFLVLRLVNWPKGEIGILNAQLHREHADTNMEYSTIAAYVMRDKVSNK